MGGKNVCFMGDEGCATCIRDDEDCMKCEPLSRIAHMKMLAEYNPKLVNTQDHAKNLSDICNQMDILNRITHGMLELSDTYHIAGLEKISSEMLWRAHAIEEITGKVCSLAKKHCHEEYIMTLQK
jgi:hypothetical protein